MARQERKFDQQLAGSGARVTNAGSQLPAILPESVALPTGSDVVDPGFRPPASLDTASADRAPQVYTSASDIPVPLAGMLPHQLDRPKAAGPLRERAAAQLHQTGRSGL